MSAVLVDSNVLLDVLTEDARWFGWSSVALARCADSALLAINPVIYAEVSVRFARIEELDVALSEEDFQRLAVPYEAAFLAGKAFCGIGAAAELAGRRSRISSSARTPP